MSLPSLCALMYLSATIDAVSLDSLYRTCAHAHCLTVETISWMTCIHADWNCISMHLKLTIPRHCAVIASIFFILALLAFAGLFMWKSRSDRHVALTLSRSQTDPTKSGFGGNGSHAVSQQGEDGKPEPSRELRAAIAAMGTDDKQLLIQDVVGKGGFGVVYRGIWRGLEVAIKTVCFFLTASYSPLIFEGFTSIHPKFLFCYKRYQCSNVSTFVFQTGNDRSLSCRCTFILAFCFKGTYVLSRVRMFCHSARTKSRSFFADVSSASVFKIKFLGYFNPEKAFEIMKKYIFWGDLTDILLKKRQWLFRRDMRQ